MKQTKLQVFHFLLDPRMGGPHVYAATLANALSLQVSSSMVTAGRSSFADVKIANLRRLWRPLYPFEVVTNVLLILLLCARKCFSKRLCILHVHGAANIAPIIACGVAGIPVVWHFHETESTFMPIARIGKVFLRPRRFKLVAVAQVVGQFYGLRDYSVLHPPIDTDYWNKPQQTANAVEKKFTIVSIGNLNPIKGHNILLQALSEADEDDWHLVIVGAPLSNYRKYRERLVKMAADIMNRRPSCKIEFVGWKSGEEVFEHLVNCDAFVLSSLSEGCPMAMLEAMAMRCVCIAADVGGVRDFIQDGSSGFIHPPGNVGALISVLKKVRALNERDRVEIGERARRIVTTECSVTALATRCLDLYNELLNAVDGKSGLIKKRAVPEELNRKCQ